jgi:hypothetical protein
MDKCLLHEGHKRIRDFFTFKHENVLALGENKIKGNTACAPARKRERGEYLYLMSLHAPPAAGAVLNFSHSRLMQYFISPFKHI